MSVTYKPVLWNKQKRIYDLTLGCFVVGYLTLFNVLTILLYPDVTEETLIIRSTASLALILLHVILMIGPLCRLHPALLPLLYNRRHLGVTMFLIAAIHGGFSIMQFHALGNVNPIVSIFSSNGHYNSWAHFPFQTLGFFALIIFMLMAVTSHDFWLHNLGPRFWKSLHMLIYVAYVLIIFHVLLGIVQSEPSLVPVILLGTGLTAIIALHLIAAFKEKKSDDTVYSDRFRSFTKVCSYHDIPNNRAKVITIGNEHIAIFRYNNKLSAVSNVCKHQLGPLGEGKIVDGCITCPWHGYQYLPFDGCSPPPFNEKISTYDLTLIDDIIWVNPKPYPEGTGRTPVYITN